VVFSARRTRRGWETGAHHSRLGSAQAGGGQVVCTNSNSPAARKKDLQGGTGSHPVQLCLQCERGKDSCSGSALTLTKVFGKGRGVREGGVHTKEEGNPGMRPRHGRRRPKPGNSRHEFGVPVILRPTKKTSTQEGKTRMMGVTLGDNCVKAAGGFSDNKHETVGRRG